MLAPFVAGRLPAHRLRLPGAVRRGDDDAADRARCSPSWPPPLAEFEIRPAGPFSLAAAQDFAGGFPPGIGGGAVSATSIAMAFPVEGTDSSAAVDISQREDGVVVGRTDAPASLLDAVRRQAARSLSLDHDGTDWPDVGERDPVIGRLQQAHGYLRPVCFYSAYEAATSFVIGQRISMRQGARVKQCAGRAARRPAHGRGPRVRGLSAAGAAARGERPCPA